MDRHTYGHYGHTDGQSNLQRLFRSKNSYPVSITKETQIISDVKMKASLGGRDREEGKDNIQSGMPRIYDK